METKNEILNELRQVSPVLAEISRKNLLKVPENYFEQLSGEIMLRINSMQQSEIFPAFFPLIDKNTPFTLPPDGYFDGFAEKMLDRIRAGSATSVDDELSSISPLLKSISRNTPFSVPEGYFEELSGNAVSAAKAIDFVNDELETISPLLSELKNKNPYTSPSGYFENLSTEILSKIKNEPVKVQVISINKRAWLKYAAAAVVVGVITTVGFFALNKSNSRAGITDPIAALSKVSDDDMNNYLQNQYSPIYDSTNFNIPLATNDLSADNDDANDLFSNVSDDELNQYINEDISFKDNNSATN